MFYDFNRHKRQAEPEKKLPENQDLKVSLENLLARIPEKVKMPLLILLISLAGLGFFRLIIDGIIISRLPKFAAGSTRQFYYRSPQTLETSLDSLEQGNIQDTLSQSSPKQ